MRGISGLPGKKEMSRTKVDQTSIQNYRPSATETQTSPNTDVHPLELRDTTWEKQSQEVGGGGSVPSMNWRFRMKEKSTHPS